MLRTILLLFILNSQVGASIFYEDDRLDYFDMPPRLQEISAGSVALILKHKLVLKNERYTLKTQNLVETLGMCNSERFSSDPIAANCSGALIGSDVILTAAHCLSKNIKGYKISDYYAVFNYKKKEEGQLEFSFSKDEVFTLKEELYYEFDLTGRTKIDLAVVRLDRKTNFRPMTVSLARLELEDKVSVLGYPLGTPLKLSNSSQIVSVLDKSNSFRHELDTFSVNSGSPILNDHLEVVGVHVRGTGHNIQVYNQDCREWQHGTPGRDFGEANDLSALQKILKSLNLL